MLRKEKVQVVLWSVVASLAAVGIIKWVLSVNQSIQSLGATDDAPIIMAGGSLYVGTGPDAVFQPNGNALNFTSGFKVFGVDIVDQNDAMQSAAEADVRNKTGALIVTYCKSNCNNAAETDTVTLNFDANSIAMVNTLSGHPISKMPKILPTLRTHMRRKWRLVSVELKINNTTFGSVAQCGDSSECSVVVHTCQAGTGCR
jgi:hypothetical protein